MYLSVIVGASESISGANISLANAAWGFEICCGLTCSDFEDVKGAGIGPERVKGDSIMQWKRGQGGTSGSRNWFRLDSAVARLCFVWWRWRGREDWMRRASQWRGLNSDNFRLRRQPNQRPRVNMRILLKFVWRLSAGLGLINRPRQRRLLFHSRPSQVKLPRADSGSEIYLSRVRRRNTHPTGPPA